MDIFQEETKRSEKLMKNPYLLVLITLCCFLFYSAATAGDAATCLTLQSASTVETSVRAAGISDVELLARLVYAETTSTGFPDHRPVYEAIAWGVMNRVRLGDASPSMQKVYGIGIRGVIFRKGQFNPAVSLRSPFSKDFLCPRDSHRWSMAWSAAEVVMKGDGNPFIETRWEREHGISLVVNFYYPRSVQAKTPLPPWEAVKGLQFIGDVSIGKDLLTAEKVRFYRLTRPPGDVAAIHPSE
jgi:hypothetical protein